MHGRAFLLIVQQLRRKKIFKIIVTRCFWLFARKYSPSRKEYTDQALKQFSSNPNGDMILFLFLLLYASHHSYMTLQQEKQ